MLCSVSKGWHMSVAVLAEEKSHAQFVPPVRPSSFYNRTGMQNIAGIFAKISEAAPEMGQSLCDLTAI
jgi:hypothetical protein